MMKVRKYFIGLLMLMCFDALAGVTDTGKVLGLLASNLRNADKLSCSYVMDAKFPNGDKDHIGGVMYINMKDKLYYNDCNLYTMVYTSDWFYQANHESKTVSIADLRREDKKLRKEREKNIFQNGLLTTFLDSVVLKNGVIKQLKYDGNRYSIKIGFRAASAIKSIEVAYDTLTNMPVSCKMITEQPTQTAQGVMRVDITADYNNFKKVNDVNGYKVDAFFSYANGNIKLKKYNSYKLVKKI